MKKLQLGTGGTLALPVDVVTQKLAFLGRTGSGKTYGATKLAELMLDAGAQVIALDPVGVWYGLRLGKGFDIAVLGGLHGDVPIEPTAGALVGELVADQGLSAVIDVSQMLRAEQIRFATAFLEALFQRRKASPAACHVFIEECQEFIPQRPARGEEKMLHIAQRVVKLGRNFGIGASQISQRPQAVNKETLNQSELLLAFQMTGPQERKVIEGWMNERGEDGAKLSNLLPKLDVGECFAWSPQWLKIHERVTIAKKRSSDASSTPTVGARARSSGKLNDFDVSKLQGALLEAAEARKANDPAVLRARVAELEQELKKVVARQDKHAPAQVKVKVREVQVPMLGKREATLLRKIHDLIALGPDILEKQRRVQQQLAENHQKAGFMVERLVNAVSKCSEACRGPHVREFVPGTTVPILTDAEVAKLPGLPGLTMPARGFPGDRPGPARAPKPAAEPRSDGAQEYGKGHMKLLTALAQHPEGRSHSQLATLTGYAPSGGFRNLWGALRRGGLIEGGNKHLRITPAGVKFLGPFEQLPTGAALRDHWYSQLGKGEATALKVLCDRYPNTLPQSLVAQYAGYEDSGGFRNIVGRLRRLCLIVGNAKGLTASETLF